MRPRHTLRQRRLGTASFTATLLAAALAACTDAPPSDAELGEGARSVAETYVAAIAAHDQETADAMTDPEDLVVPEVDDMVDVRAALPEATEPISETWIGLLGTDPAGSSTYVRFQVSYLIGDLVGAGTIELAHHRGDPADKWTVTDGLLVSGVAFADADTVPAFTLGGIELEPPSSSNRHVWGYPGAYLTEAIEPAEDVTIEPITVVIGAETVPPWDDPLPMLEGASED